MDTGKHSGATTRQLDFDAGDRGWTPVQASVLALRRGAQVQVADYAPLVANASGVLLLNAGEPVLGLAGPADLIELPAQHAEHLARTLAVPSPATEPFPTPWMRLRTDEFLRLRLLLRDRGDVAGLDGWLQRLMRDAQAERRKRLVPAAEAFELRGRFDLAQAMAGYLDAEWRRNVSLAEMAQVFGLTSFHLLRVFRRETGLTPHQYALQLRLRLTLFELEARRPRLGELGLDAGFSSPAHFSSSFRGAFGLTPAQYAGSR